MDSNWCISTLSGELTLLLAYTASPEVRARSLPAHLVTADIARLGMGASRGTFLRYSLEPLFAKLVGRPPHAITMVTMCNAVIAALHDGRLIAVRDDSRTAIPATSRTSPVEPAEEASFDAPVPEELEWIEIELVDEAGDPVGNQRYHIETSDGATREGRLNAKGFARVDRIAPGTCKVHFPDYHKSSWSAA